MKLIKLGNHMAKAAPLHPQEDKRLEALQALKILDTLSETDFDELVALASEICETPISLVSLIDKDRQWFKAKVGLDATETSRTIAFCSHAILQDEVFIIQDSLQDERFKDNVLVSGFPFIRFYAGAPLITKEGFPIGTLCAIDSKPRSFTPLQIQTLKTLSKLVINQMELRLAVIKQNEGLEFLEKLNLDKDRFFSIISHDLRAPFNGLVGMSSLILDEFESLDKSEIYEYTQVINKSALSAHRLVDNLLNWSLQEGGSLKPDMKSISLLELGEDVKQTLNVFAKQKEIDLKTSGDWNVEVSADQNLLRSTLINLASNAIKFTGLKGSVELIAAKTNDTVTITVKDNGVGIPEDKLTKLRKFGESKSSMGTHGEAGSGLGLKLCFQFLNLMESKLEVESVANAGTSFSFKLKTHS
jgi:signal transduction histidine kinase